MSETPLDAPFLFSFEDRVARMEKAIWGDESTCPCGGNRLPNNWCTGGHYREHWGPPDMESPQDGTQ